MKNIVAAAMVAFAGLAAHALQIVPAGGSWKGVTAELNGDRTFWKLRDASGADLCMLHGEPWGKDVSGVRIKVDGDRLSIDPSAAFAAGVKKILLTGARLDHAGLLGRDCTMKVDLEGSAGTDCTLYFEGQTVESKHFYRYCRFPQRGERKTAGTIQWIDAGLKELHIRFDIEKFAGRPLLLGAFKVGTLDELPLREPRPVGKPELVFRLPFDGTAEADVGKGRRTPLEERGIVYAEGKRGKAARFGSAAGSRLRYAIADNMNVDCGTIAMWLKREWDFSSSKTPWQCMFSFPHPTDGSDRKGSGALWFWWYGDSLRGDVSDVADSYRTYLPPRDDRWMHVAFSWDDDGVVMHVNGNRVGSVDDGVSPMVAALKTVERGEIDRSGFREFFVGNRQGFATFNGLVDDFRIYSAPLGDAGVRALWKELADPAKELDPPPDYAAVAARDTKSYVLPAAATGGVPGVKTLVDEVRLDASLPSSRFHAVGETRFAELDGVRYLEAGAKENDRFAVRFKLDPGHPLYCFEFDYPDDAKRTADILLQPAKSWSYAMEVGYAAGGEYPNSGKMLTHRCLWWGKDAEVAAIVMTARAGERAALSAIRVYRIDGLPEAGISEPPANARGSHRSFALYFEDPSVGQEYGLDESYAATPEGLCELADRIIAGMKYVGQNTLAYPGAWYHGLIGPAYNPRNHAPRFLSGFYEKFDRAGLQIYPTLNVNNMPVPPGLVTRASMSNGALHDSPIAIHDTGRPNWGGWHDTPPNFNVLHPDVRRYIERMVDELVAQGGKHPSFRGVCFHLTRHCLLWCGDEQSGYNDACVQAFAKAKGLKIPVDASDPMRGAAYAKWIRANCREEWIQWRCDQVTAFYVSLAKRLRQARPDLRLWLNSFAPADVHAPDFGAPDFMRRSNRACGLDAEALQRAIPNLVLCQSMVPADYRKNPDWVYPSPAAREAQRVLELRPGFYDLLAPAVYPWVNQHDRYWESAVGGSGALNCGWLTEMGWRVGTINPAGRHSLRPFVAPLRFRDVLGMSKGGFLIGTYGMEDVLVPFMRAFRALPAVVMKDVPGGSVDGAVRMRSGEFGGRTYFYVVNAGECAATAEVVFPKDAVDLVTGRPAAGGTLALEPYEMRSYSAPKGVPRWR